MNLAATLARSGRRVLLVDSDPQCNLTSYLIQDEVVDELLDTADSPNGQTIWSGVQPVAEALGGFKPIRPLETGIKKPISDPWRHSFIRVRDGFS
jgi:nitrogenase subunit NifH